MIDFEFYEYGDLDAEEINSLASQKVYMSYWDYVLFVPSSFSKYFVASEGTKGELEPISYQVQRLLTGCAHNSWHKVKDFKGRQGILGVAYNK